MKIKKVETFSTRDVSFVRVETEDGHEGFGQISPFHSNLAAMVLHQQVAKHVLGYDGLQIEQFVDRAIAREYKHWGSHLCRAVCGIETALWDLKGKIEDKSVSELISGKRSGAIDVYASSMSREITPEDEATRLARLQDQYGYRAFKIRVGSVFGNDKDQWPGRTESLVPTVKRGLDPSSVIHVDANSCYTPQKAIEVGRMLEQYELGGHFEEPCPFPEIEWTAQVNQALSIPVAGGEQDHDMTQWRRMIDMRAVDIIQPDICYLGGMVRSLRVAEMGAKAGLLCTPHSANVTMVSVFTLHFLNAIPNAGPYMEFSIEDDPWAQHLFDPVLQVRDGKIAIPDGPGWGVTIRKDWLDKADYQVSEWHT